MAVCGFNSDDVKLFVVPTSLNDPRAAGLIVLPPDNFKTQHAPRGLPLARFGERLLIPIDAVLHPPISATEADEYMANLDDTLLAAILDTKSIAVNRATHRNTHLVELEPMFP